MEEEEEAKQRRWHKKKSDDENDIRRMDGYGINQEKPVFIKVDPPIRFKGMQLHREIQEYLNSLPVELEKLEESESEIEERKRQELIKEEEKKELLMGDNYSTDLARWTTLFNFKKIQHCSPSRSPEMK